MTLHLLDLKQYMYTGVSKVQTVTRGVIEDSGGYRPREFRCGSLAYVIDEVYRILADKDNVICFCIDTPPIVKREMSEQYFHRQYKGGRQKAPAHVTYQFEFAINMVKQIGFNFVMLEGYEADDCIASVVRKYKNAYDKIVIHSNDSDQYYLVSDKTTVVPTSLKGKTVNMSNYETVVSKDRFVPYNTNTLSKLMHGEPGDNIIAAPYDCSKRLQKLIPPIANKYLGDNELLKTIIKNTCSNDEQTMKVFELLAPVEILDERVIIDPSVQINGELLRFFGIEFQSYSYQRYNYYKYPEGEEMIEDFLDYLIDKEVI